MSTVITGPTAPPVLPPGAGGANLLSSQNPDNPGGAGGVGLLDVRNLGAGAQVGAALTQENTIAELRTLVPGANVTLTQTAQTIEIAAAGGAVTPPAAPATSVQFNNGGAFGGNANVTIAGTGVLSSLVATQTPLVQVADNALAAFALRELVSGDNWISLSTNVNPTLRIGSDATASASLELRASAKASALRFVTQAGDRLLLLDAALGFEKFTIGGTTATGAQPTGLDLTMRFDDAFALRFLALDGGGNPRGYLTMDTSSGAEVITIGNSITDPDVVVSTQGSITLGIGSSLIGVLGATPVVRQTALATTAGFSAGAGTPASDDSTYTGDSGATAYTVGDLVRILKLYGWLVP